MRFRDWFGQLDRGHRVLVCTWGSVFLCMLLSPLLLASIPIDLLLKSYHIYEFVAIFNMLVCTFIVLLATQWLVMGPGSIMVRWLICLMAFYFEVAFHNSILDYNFVNTSETFSSIIIIWTFLRGCKLLELKSLAEVERDRQQPWQFSIKHLLVIVTLFPLLIYFPSYINTYQWRNLFGLAQFLIVTNLLVLGTHSHWWNIILVPWAMTSWCWLNTKKWSVIVDHFRFITNGVQSFQRVSSHPYYPPSPQLTWVEELQQHLAETYEPLLQPSGLTLVMSSMTAIYLSLLWCQRYAGYRLVLNRSQPPAAIVPMAESVNPLTE